ncbi:hypothetical protein AB0D13_09130 [Streptomyces sp. NPDC048430]|uniref:hypothetical protein n=1 Tax=Streptomyces sp. NPDC048430 TaxID=3155388 RepID=UPI003442DCAB
MPSYSNMYRQYRIVFGDDYELPFQLPDNIQRTPELDAKAAALIEAYHAFSSAGGRISKSQVWYTESTNGMTTDMIIERGDFV